MRCGLASEEMLKLCREHSRPTPRDESNPSDRSLITIHHSLPLLDLPGRPLYGSHLAKAALAGGHSGGSDIFYMNFTSLLDACRQSSL